MQGIDNYTSDACDWLFYVKKTLELMHVIHELDKLTWLEPSEQAVSVIVVARRPNYIGTQSFDGQQPIVVGGPGLWLRKQTEF